MTQAGPCALPRNQRICPDNLTFITPPGTGNLIVLIWDLM